NKMGNLMADYVQIMSRCLSRFSFIFETDSISNTLKRFNPLDCIGNSWPKEF
ncbi:MAG: hypothetical protein ACI9N9_002160, partial [Enterobacterales bacterium]